MGRKISYFFQLVLCGFSYLLSDTIYEDFRVFEIFVQKSFEPLPYQWFRAKSQHIIFVLLPLLQYCPSKKQHGKENLIKTYGSNSFKMVFILLKKIIAFYV